MLQRRRLGEAVATVLLAFGALMAASIAGMMLVMRLRAAHASAGVIGGMTGLALANGLLLARVVRATAAKRAAS